VDEDIHDSMRDEPPEICSEDYGGTNAGRVLPIRSKESKKMSLDQFHQMMLRQQEARKHERKPQLPLFEAYDSSEDVGSVRLLWLEAALKARRAPESEG
jgi:hypothetical protein